MKEAKLIRFLTEFITSSEFGSFAKSFNVNKQDEELKLEITFDLSKLEEKQIEELDAKPVEEEPIYKVIRDDDKFYTSDATEITGKELKKILSKPEVFKEEPCKLVQSVKEMEEEDLEETPYIPPVTIEPEEDEVPEEKEVFISPKDVKDYFDKQEQKQFIESVVEEKLEEKAKEPEIKSLADLGTITADENGNVSFVTKGVTSKSVEKTPEDLKIEHIQKTTNALSNKSLYKDHFFTDDEITYIKAYLKSEITGGEGAELLGLERRQDFYNLVTRYKRSKNLTKPRKKPSKAEKDPSRPNQKVTEADLDYIYSQVKRGDTLSNFCKEFGIASSTMTIRMRKYIEKHGLEPLFVNSKPKETEKAKPAKKKIVATVSPETPDGWQIASDNKFHLIKNGLVVE